MGCCRKGGWHGMWYGMVQCGAVAEASGVAVGGVSVAGWGDVKVT